MKVLEQFIESKTGNQSLCEDSIFLNESFAAVIDGATSKSGPLPDGKTRGRMASELIKNALMSIPGKASSRAIFDSVDKSINDFYVLHGMLDDVKANPLHRLSATVIVYSDYLRKIFRVGDGAALIDGELVTVGRDVDRLNSEVRAFYLEGEILGGKSIDELLERDTGREYILELLRVQVLFQNSLKPSPYTYFVIDGLLPAGAPVEEYPVPETAREVVLASDGYPVLLPSLKDTEQALALVLKDDPLCFRLFKSTKGVYKGNLSFDDRSYIRIDVSRKI